LYLEVKLFLNAGDGVWWHMPVTPDTLEAKVGGLQSEASQGKSGRLSEKQTKSKNEDVDQVVEYLVGEWKALSSIPSTTKRTNAYRF
jgi:hypothetical protein